MGTAAAAWGLKASLTPSPASADSYSLVLQFEGKAGEKVVTPPHFMQPGLQLSQGPLSNIPNAFYFEAGFAKLPRLASVLQSSCLCLE